MSSCVSLIYIYIKNEQLINALITMKVSGELQSGVTR